VDSSYRKERKTGNGMPGLGVFCTFCGIVYEVLATGLHGIPRAGTGSIGAIGSIGYMDKWNETREV
jgi:hypothetical protein